MKTAEEYLNDWVKMWNIEPLKIDSCRFTGQQMKDFAEAYHQQKLKEMMPSDEEISNAFNDAYIKAGDNTYFGNGFKRGVEFLKDKLLND